MGDYDRAARLAAHREPQAVIDRLGALAGLRWRFVEWTETQTTPQPGERDQTADRVAVLEDEAGQAWLALLEFQSRHDAGKIDDVLAEAGQFRRSGLWRERKPRVVPILIYLTGECPAAEAVVDMTVPAGFGIRHAPLIWEIGKDSATEALDGVGQGTRTWGTLFWVSLMAGAETEAVARRWYEMVTALPDERQRLAVGAIGGIFAGLAGRGQLWWPLVEGWKMTESPILNEWIEQASSQSRLEGMRGSLLRFLTKRLGVVPADITATINAQPSVDLLNDWIDQAATVATMDEFRAYLRR